MCTSLEGRKWQKFGFYEKLKRQLKRTSSYYSRKNKRGPFYVGALDVALLFHEFNWLGILSPPEPVVKCGTVPLIFEYERAGHVGELSFAISDYCYQFLMLHEIAHVLLRHIPNLNEEKNKSQEIEADTEALDLLILISNDPNDLVAGYCGAIFFFFCLQIMEIMESPHSTGDTHPTPALRRTNLLSHLKGANIPFLTKLLIKRTISDLNGTLARYIESSAGAKKNIKLDNPVLHYLDMAYRDQDPEAFIGTFLRQIASGASLLLYSALMSARNVIFEMEISDERDFKLKVLDQLSNYSYDAKNIELANSILANYEMARRIVK